MLTTFWPNGKKVVASIRIHTKQIAMTKQLKIGVLLTVLIVFGSQSLLFAQDKTTLTEAPIKVQELIAKKYAKYKVASIRQNEKATEYKVELEKGSRTVSLVVDTDGTVLSKSKGRIYSYDGTEKPPNDGTPHNERDGHQH